MTDEWGKKRTALRKRSFGRLDLSGVRTGPRLVRGKGARSLASTEPAVILVVDDLEINREFAKAILELEGYTVEAVCDAQEAIQSVATQKYDLVLMDVQMPVMDGMAATQAIRALDDDCRDIPILALSSNVNDADLRSYLMAGMNGYVEKPLDPLSFNQVASQYFPAQSAPDSKRDVALLDHEKLDEIVHALGTERVGKLTEKFATQLDSSFLSISDTAKREAHDLINIAGVLGLERLVDVCREIDDAPAPAGRKYTVLIGKARRLKTKVLKLCHEKILPGLHRDRYHKLS